jgi:hypothetical protein
MLNLIVLRRSSIKTKNKQRKRTNNAKEQLRELMIQENGLSMGHRIDRDGWLVREDGRPAFGGSRSFPSPSGTSPEPETTPEPEPSRVTDMVVPTTVSRPISSGSQILNTITRKHPIKKHVPEKRPTANKWVDDPSLAYKPYDPRFCNCHRLARDGTDQLCNLHHNQLLKTLQNGGLDLPYGRFNEPLPNNLKKSLKKKKTKLAKKQAKKKMKMSL